ncbi:MAG: glycosyltransferase family 39 protein [Spirochaetales bacterium]|nr:glycosyltransferase family 39 protein [Spirochaetales bacterium]
MIDTNQTRDNRILLFSELSFSPTEKQTRVIHRILLIIMILSFFLRIAFFNQNPPALNQDEAMHGVNAYSISRTIKDHRGFFLPAQMHGFGNIGIVSPLYTYLTVPFVGIFGLSETTTRLAALLINLALLPVVFLFTGNLFKNRIIGLLATGLSGLNPWHLHYSRIAHEATLCPFFFLLFCLLLYLILTKENYKKLFPVAGIILGLSFYTYQVAWVMSPILFLFTSVLFFKESIKRYKELLFIAGIAFVIALPILFTNVFARETWMESRLASVAYFDKPDGFLMILKNFFYYFSFDFLFLKGDMHIWTLPGNAQRYGMFHPYMIVFLTAGITYLVIHLIARKKMRREIILTLGMIVLYALPASATEPIGWSLRAYTLIPAFHITGAIGIWVLIKSIPADLISKKISSFITLSLIAITGLYIVFQAVVFFYNYYTVYPALPENFGAYQYGMKEVGEYIKENEDNYSKIYITRDINQPFIYILFYTHYDPLTYQMIEKDENPLEWGAVFQFDRYYFMMDKEMPLNEPDTLFITRWSAPLQGKKLLKRITDPMGDTQFQIWE